MPMQMRSGQDPLKLAGYKKVVCRFSAAGLVSSLSLSLSFCLSQPPGFFATASSLPVEVTLCEKREV